MTQLPNAGIASQLAGQTQPTTVPAKFVDGSGNVNVQSLAQSLTHIGGTPMQYMRGDGSFDVNAMGAAYATLEAARGTAAVPAAQAAPATPAVPNPAALPALNTEAVTTPAGVNWAAVTQELATTGAISPAMQAELKSANVPDAIIQQHTAGVKAIAENNLRRLADQVGGIQQYEAFVGWANQNLPVEQRQQLAVAMNTEGGHFALQGAFAQFRAAGGGGAGIAGEPGDITNVGGGGGDPGVGSADAPFTSQRERQAAFKDRRYGTDPAFTQMVQQRQRATSAAAQQ